MFIPASGEEKLDKVAPLQNHPEQILFQTNWVKRMNYNIHKCGHTVCGQFIPLEEGSMSFHELMTKSQSAFPSEQC